MYFSRVRQTGVVLQVRPPSLGMHRQLGVLAATPTTQSQTKISNLQYYQNSKLNKVQISDIARTHIKDLLLLISPPVVPTTICAPSYKALTAFIYHSINHLPSSKPPGNLPRYSIKCFIKDYENTVSPYGKEYICSFFPRTESKQRIN